MTDLIETIKRIALDAVATANPVNILFGTVTKANPLQISIEQRLTLDKEHLILTSLVSKFKVDMTADGITREYGIDLSLKAGESIMLLRVQGGQKFIVLDRMR